MFRYCSYRSLAFSLKEMATRWKEEITLRVTNKFQLVIYCKNLVIT